MTTINRFLRLNFRMVNNEVKRSFHNKHYGNNSKYSKYGKTALPTIFAAGTLAASWLSYNLSDDPKDNKDGLLKSYMQDEVGKFKKNLPTYSLDDVAKHSTVESRIWVTYKQGVYDITDFIPKHPGRDNILLAAGTSVEPFWMLYAVHKTDKTFSMLEEMRIGNLSDEDSQFPTENMDDPYASDPRRHPALVPASKTPFNAELGVHMLADNFHTPNDLFYVRNHLPVPIVDLATYELSVEVDGTKKSITLTMDQIKKLPKYTMNATIMCGGNRRSEMSEVKAVKGLNWGPGAIGNASWTGVKLRDVLKLVGITDETAGYKHVQFEGLDTDPTSHPYGASIPFWKAVDKRGDVLLAYEMNGQPLSRDHGFPIRVVVPGTVGARNVKWLSRIVVSTEESTSHWQTSDYKGFSPSVDWDTVDFSKSPAIQELPVISAICNIQNDQTVKVKDGHVFLKGYAWSGGGQKIVRVDVTADGGKTWHVAQFDAQDEADSPQHWAWTLWSAKVPVAKGTKKVEFWAKAVDSCYNTQPESFKNIWNLRGVLSNAYHRVRVNLAWK